MSLNHRGLDADWILTTAKVSATDWLHGRETRLAFDNNAKCRPPIGRCRHQSRSLVVFLARNGTSISCRKYSGHRVCVSGGAEAVRAALQNCIDCKAVPAIFFGAGCTHDLHTHIPCASQRALPTLAELHPFHSQIQLPSDIRLAERRPFPRPAHERT